MKINVLSDFKIIENIDERGVPFKFTYYVWKNVKVASYDGLLYRGCKAQDDGTILVPFDRELCEPGVLKVRREFFVSDHDFADGVCNKVTDGEVLAVVKDADGQTHLERVELVKGPTDGDIQVDSEVETGMRVYVPQGIDVTSWFENIPVIHSEVFPDHSYEMLLREMRKHNFAYQLFMKDRESDNSDLLTVDYTVSNNDRITLTAYSPILGKVHSLTRYYFDGMWEGLHEGEDFQAKSYDLYEIEQNANTALEQVATKAEKAYVEDTFFLQKDGDEIAEFVGGVAQAVEQLSEGKADKKDVEAKVADIEGSLSELEEQKANDSYVKQFYTTKVESALEKERVDAELEKKADDETFTAVTDSIYEELDKLDAEKATKAYVDEEVMRLNQGILHVNSVKADKTEVSEALSKKVDMSIYSETINDTQEQVRKVSEKAVALETSKQDSLDEDTVVKGELYRDDGSGEVVPVRHPDLSTQPSILPYKFAGNYVYEQMVWIPESIIDSKLSNQDGQVVPIDVAYLVGKPIILDARLSIFRENFRITLSHYCRVDVDSFDAESVKTTITFSKNVPLSEINGAWLRIVYTSQPKSNGGYYYYSNAKEEIPKGIYVSLPRYIQVSGLQGISEGVLIKESPFDIPVDNSLWYLPDDPANVGTIILHDPIISGDISFYRGYYEDAKTKEPIGNVYPYSSGGQVGLGLEYRGQNVTHALITVYSI